MSKYKDIFDKNIRRVEGLNKLYTDLKEKNQKDKDEYKLTDSLRAAVVLLHSSFEEYFRCILIEWLPIKANSETLKQIPIAHKAGKKPDKIFLNDLAEYRDKTVNDIIQDSITEHMKLKSFNNENDIRSWCSKIGINLDGFNEMNQVDRAVHRRHKIVHEADLKKDNNNEKSKLMSIKSAELSTWINAYKRLVDYIEVEIEKWEDDKCQN